MNNEINKYYKIENFIEDKIDESGGIIWSERQKKLLSLYANGLIVKFLF